LRKVFEFPANNPYTPPPANDYTPPDDNAAAASPNVH
jgi:hypothetical protein